MASQKLAEVLAQLSPEEIEELRAGFGAGNDVDEYRREIVQDAVKEWEKRYAPILGDVAKQAGIAKLTAGLSPEAARYIEEQFKDKPADHVLGLANDAQYSAMFRGAAQAAADKEAAAASAVAEATKGDGAKPAATTDVDEFKKEMKSKMGVEFSDDEAREAMKDIDTMVPGQVVM